MTGEFKPRNTARARELRNQATPAERLLWTALSGRKLRGHKFSRQMPVGPYFADFLCREAAVIVEIDGFSHETGQEHDQKRDRWLSEQGYRVMRFTNEDVLGNCEGVTAMIASELEDDTHPQPLPQAGGEQEALRKTLSVGAVDEAPALKKKGRGWEISESRLDALHTRARALRRESSPAHKALAERFAKADLGRYTFKRHAVIGSAIVDFACHNLGMAIAIDEEGVDPAIATRRDKSLEAVGIRTMHIAAADILDNIDAVLERITAGMRLRIADKQEARRAHHAARGGRR